MKLWRSPSWQSRSWRGWSEPGCPSTGLLLASRVWLDTLERVTRRGRGIALEKTGGCPERWIIYIVVELWEEGKGRTEEQEERCRGGVGEEDGGWIWGQWSRLLIFIWAAGWVKLMIFANAPVAESTWKAPQKCWWCNRKLAALWTQWTPCTQWRRRKTGVRLLCMCFAVFTSPYNWL